MIDEPAPRLTRQERGQVRRVINRLSCLERREFPSSTGHRSYVVMIMPGGKVTCNCRGWTVKRGDAPRQCVHLHRMLRDRMLRTDEEFLYVHNYMTDLSTTREFNALVESRAYRRILTEGGSE